MPKPFRLDGTAVKFTSMEIVAVIPPHATLGGRQNMPETRGCACENAARPIFQACDFRRARSIGALLPTRQPRVLS
jgi:hypothetical protein